MLGINPSSLLRNNDELEETRAGVLGGLWEANFMSGVAPAWPWGHLGSNWGFLNKPPKRK